MRRRARIRAAAVLTIVAMAALAGSAERASAHPLGNFTVNTYAGVHVLPGTLRVDYVVDLAEIPAFQELTRIDADGDGAAQPDELQVWADARAPRLADGLDVVVDGRRLPLTVGSALASVRPGQAGLSTLRFEGVFAATIAERGALEVHDGNFAGRIGWHELTVAGEDGRALAGASVPATSVSDDLRAYPADLLSSPLDVRDASARFAPGPSVGGGAADLPDPAASPARPLVEGGPFAGLVSNHGVGLVALGILLALAFGAWHALLPGHGKTLMAAYLVGSGARLRHAVAVGVAVAAMHTASVLALGLSVLGLERTFRPETLYPWLGLVSGVVALALGAGLLVGRTSAWVAARRGRGSRDGHGHDHEHGHAHHHGHRHPESPDGTPAARPLSRRGLVALALAGGILPAPSALLVLLASINLHRVAYGLGLVLAFSLGLAGALIVVGVGAMRARDAVSARLSGSLGRVLPVLSAAAIVAVGLYLTVRGVAQV